MISIKVDNEVYNKLLELKIDDKESENDILRRIFLKDCKALKAPESSVGIGFKSEGVYFPTGTLLRCIVKKKGIYGTINKDTIRFNGKSYKTFSAAASALYGYRVNGWEIFACRFPNSKVWVPINFLKNRSKNAKIS